MRFDREDKSLIADWWFTVDRVLLAAILAFLLSRRIGTQLPGLFRQLGCELAPPR